MANGRVLMAAAGSYVLMSRWPEILVGVVCVPGAVLEHDARMMQAMTCFPQA
jgi:hypothetical protein